MKANLQHFYLIFPYSKLFYIYNFQLYCASHTPHSHSSVNTSGKAFYKVYGNCFRRAFVRSDANVGQEDLDHGICADSFQKCSMRSRFSSHQTHPSSSSLLTFILYIGMRPFWNNIPKLFPTELEHEIVQNVFAWQRKPPKSMLNSMYLKKKKKVLCLWSF